MLRINKKEDVKRKFIDRIEQGKSIRYKDIKNEDSSLLYAIERHFGGIFKIAKEIGLTEDELINKYGLTRNINKRTLTEEEIRNRLIYLKSIGRLSTSAMRTEFEDYRLETSLKKIYGSVKNGLEYFGLERDTVKITKDGLIKEIRYLSEQGVDMSYINMVNNHSKLVNNATNIFGKGWYGILEELNIKYKAKREPFTKEGIKHRVFRLKEKYGEVNYEIMRKYDSSILYYAYENYNSLIDFYIDLGLNPNEHMDFSRQTVKGFMFEGVFREILDLLNIEYKYNTYFDSKIRPDFQLNNRIWIDCKLSSWTNSIESTINKYTPHCNKLIIVFLRGKLEYAERYANPKVEFRKVDYYYPFLNNINRQDIIEKLNQINNNDFLEPVTTARLTS